MDSMACRVCKGVLNVYTDATNGTREYVHGRPWVDADHEPEPVAVDMTQVQMACDFCPTDEAPVTVFIGDEIEFTIANQQNQYSAGWSACRQCDLLVVAEDFDGLRDRAYAVADAHIAASGGALMLDPEQRRDPRPLWAKFVPTIHRRQTLTTVVRLNPGRIPKARDALMALMRGWADTAFSPLQLGRDLSALLADSLEHAEMDWVSAEFTVLAGAAALNLDLAEVVLTADDLPSTDGLMVWGDLIATMPGRQPGYADVVALSWTRHHDRDQGDSVILIPYAQAEQVVHVPDADLQQLRRTIGWLVPVCAPLRIIFGTPGELDPWTADLVRIIYSTWFLMAQPGVGETVPAVLDKSLRRSYARAKRPAPEVRIVELRRHQRRAGTAGRTFVLSVRFMVKGHWRNQPYGPRSALRRWRYISPFLKGPDGAPLQVSGDVPVVRVLR